MALRFLDGQGGYTDAQKGRKWTGPINVSGFAALAVSAGNGRNGQASLRTTLTAGGGAWVATVRRTFDNQATWIVGFAFRTSVFQTGSAAILLQVLDAGTNVQVDLRLNTNATLSVTRNGTALTGGSSVNALTLNTWYYVELQVTISASISPNSCQVYVNGVSWANVAAAQSTRATANSVADTVVLGPNSNGNNTQAGGTMDIGDVYALDGQAGSNTPWGDTRVYTLRPSGNGTTSQWVNNGGTSVNNYSKVNSTTSGDGTTGYVQSGTPADLDTYALDDLPVGVATVRGVQTQFTAEETDVGPRTLGACLRSGGANHDTAGQQLTGGYLMYLYAHDQDPNGPAAWTPAAVNALEAGPVLVS